jgi:hypothetical protein
MSWIWRSIRRATGQRSDVGDASGGESSRRDTLRMDAALSYRSDLTLAQQLERLNAAGPYEWIERDSHWYPDYISTLAYPDYGFFKIFDAVDGRFNLTIKLVTDRAIVAAELAALLRTARESVLSVVAAEDIQKAEPYD